MLVSEEERKAKARETNKEWMKEYNKRPNVITKRIEYNASPKRKAKMKERYARPEVKAKMREYKSSHEGKAKMKERYARPEVKAKMREYFTSPEGKAKMREYRSSPEGKAKMREYNARPEVIVKRKVRKKEYAQRPEVKTRMKAYRTKPEVKARLKKYESKPEVKARRSKYSKNRREGVRDEVFSVYSKIHSNSDIPCCRCCGLNSHVVFLTLDHIGGKKQMDSEPELVKLGYSSNFKTTSLLIWIKKNNFPKGFQVLCMNCNWGKGHSKDNKCPHELTN